jgi:DNA-binding MurR/RpiR family transcriptional regulator
MLFKQFYDEDLAQGSYFIGCQATGEAIVVDPWRDIQTYLDEATRNNMKIVAVTETPIFSQAHWNLLAQRVQNFTCLAKVMPVGNMALTESNSTTTAK